MDKASKILLEPKAIHLRLVDLSQEIVAYFGDTDFLVVGLMNGVFIFLADLVRLFPYPVEIAFLRASSYGQSTESGEIRVDSLDRYELQGRRILLVDDILDTGKTLSYVRQCLLEKGASIVDVCVLLNKPNRRVVPVEAKFIGFTIANEFVVGYGLDYAEKYRNLPGIWAIRP
ncbi:MAG TPA: hypoxanthine phosphoribosyltransferase [Fibrobacteraceae bacterium]|nr:hypoxanthine phosphoribosyltransferase [Fibrobacteraceae bacterium]